MKKSESKIGLLKTIKEKLEIDNPKRYIDGYYQLSKKQKWLWLLGLFLVGVVFACGRVFVLTDIIKSSFDVMFIVVVLGSLSFVAVSLIPALLFYHIFRNSAKYSSVEDRMDLEKNPNKKAVIFYQLWTIFFIVVLISIIFGIPFKSFIPHY